MNELLKFLNSHSSCRNFTGRDISAADEELIAATAQRSPTSSNLQAYSIIGIRDDITKKTLTALCGGQQHVWESSLFLVFCADLNRLSTLSLRRGYPFHGELTESFIIATVDTALAACRGLMAAQALGFGGVMVGGIRNNPDEVCDLLNLPELVYPVMGMSLGEPSTQTKLKPRLPLSTVYFKDHYKQAQIEKGINEYDLTIDRIGYLKGREIDPEKYGDFNRLYSWAEHVSRRMADRLNLRPHMAEFLQKRGFINDQT